MQFDLRNSVYTGISLYGKQDLTKWLHSLQLHYRALHLSAAQVCNLENIPELQAGVPSFFSICPYSVSRYGDSMWVQILAWSVGSDSSRKLPAFQHHTF